MDQHKPSDIASWMNKSSNAVKNSSSSSMRPSMLPLPLALHHGSSSNPFNIAKARADAAAACGNGSRASSYRSRRQSVGSQMSFSSKSMRSTKSRRTGKSFKTVEITEHDIIQVFDEHGNDVTPKPLVELRTTALHEQLLQDHTDRFTPESERPSVYSRYSIASSLSSFTPDTLDNDASEKEEGDGNLTRLGTGAASAAKELAPDHKENQKWNHIVYSAIQMPIRQEDSERLITVTLMESDTFELMSLRGHTLNNNYQNVKDVLERNSRYKTLLQLKVGSDNYSNSSAQTLFSLQKTKEIQVSAKQTETEACQANSWDISDSIAKRRLSESNDLPVVENRPIFMESSLMSEAAKDARIVSILVSSGYLESSTSAAALQGNMAQRIGGAGNRRQQSMAVNTALSKRGSVFGGYIPSRRGSRMGSVLASRRESVSGSVAGSRRGSTSGSNAPSRRGSTMGNILFPVRGPKQSAIAPDVSLLTKVSTIERPMCGIENVTGALMMAEETSGSTQKDFDLSKLVGLDKILEIAERALAQNSFHDKLLFYRDFRPRDISEEEEEPSSPTCIASKLEDPAHTAKRLSWLWDFNCDMTEGRNISCLAWNKVSSDLLTVGYGQFEFCSQKDGLMAFWSLKNPFYPHATIPATSGVTALDFSSSSPNLLAVGFYCGNIAIYDVRNPKDPIPVVKSGVSMGKHNDPVWKVQWIDSNSDHGESLVSISTDGRVTQWFLKKELEYVTLMTLKRVPSNSKGAQSQPFISRRAAGMCFDFSPRDPNIYLVGTEEGRIHKCSRSYNEQYLRTYVGHTGPVFQVRWSPFVPSLFLSCSSDWTVRLWQEDKDTALLVFQSGTQSLQDLRCSLTNASVFGTVSDSGHLEIWDLSVSAVKPTVVQDEKRNLSCLLFCQTSPIVVAAGSNGAVSVFRLVGFDSEEKEIDEAQKLRKALSANVNASDNTLAE